jgi:3-deoxy-D-manno-octulosonate 8-phosphate phosphatase (KDO 8-P phosphatase)
MKSYKEKLPFIKTFIFDVDGVLTTGEVLLNDGKVIRTMHSKDGYAIQYAVKMGYRILIITGGNSVDVKERLLGLGIEEVLLSSHDKVAVYESCKSKYAFTDEEVLYMGDDIPDYKVMQMVGLSTCPQDSAVEIKSLVDYQSPIFGGKGCVRDVIEQTLRSQNNWFTEKAFAW